MSVEQEERTAGEQSDEPVVLDERRGMMAQKATDIRRHLLEIEADQAALRNRQQELEKFLLASPAATWVEAAEKARYLLTLFAATSTGRDPRRRRIIASVLDDFARLSAETADDTAEPPPRDDGPGPETRPESATERNERLQAGDTDRAASRRATESSRGKRQRGGGVDPKGSPRPRA